MFITFDPNPTNEDMNVLFRGISMMAREKMDLKAPSFFAFLLKNENGETQGGANGLVYYGGIYLDQVYVDPTLRGQGYGRQLMEKVENYARDEGCGFVHLVTMSWEARPFYEHRGFTLEFERTGYDKSQSCYHMIKRL